MNLSFSFDLSRDDIGLRLVLRLGRVLALPVGDSNIVLQFDPIVLGLSSESSEEELSSSRF